MNVAVCMSGQLRTYQNCYENLMKYIIEPLNADLFIQIWDTVGASHKEQNINNDQVDEATITRMYNPKKLVIESQPDGSDRELYGKKVPQGVIDIEPLHFKSALSMYYQIKSCNDLAVNYANEKGFEYDVLIRIRPDTVFLEQIPNKLIKKILNRNNVLYYVDYAIDTNFQVCDKFAVGDTKGMINYTSLWDKIEEYWKEPAGANPPYTHKVGERLLKHHIDVNKFHATPFYMNLYTLRNNGERLHYKGFNMRKYLKYYIKQYCN